MSHGYEFYESSLSHLVDSLVQVPEVPWSQIQRILALCPRVDSSSCTVSLRQHIAVCAAADYFTRSNGQHAVNLKSYFVSLISSLPKITWNLSKNQIRVEEDFVAYLMTDKICRALLEVKVKDGDVFSTLTECFDTLLALVQDNDYVNETDNDKLLNFLAPSLLGLIDGMNSLPLSEPPSDVTAVDVTTLVTEALLHLLSGDTFSGLCDLWVSLSRSHPPHPMENFPFQLMAKMQNLFRTLMSSIKEDDVLDSVFKATQNFIDVEYAKMYPKFKQPNVVSRSSYVSTVSVSALCECLDVSTQLITEPSVYQHYQKLSSLFNTTVNCKTPDLIRVNLQVCCVRNIGLLTTRFPLFVDDAIEIYKQMLFGPSTNVALLHVASCLEPVPRAANDHSSNFQRAAHLRRSNRPKAENVYTTKLDTLRSAIISSLISVMSAVHNDNPQTCQGFLSSASNQLLTVGDQDNQMIISTNAVRVLGAIATNLSDFETVKMVIQIFRHKICNPPSHLDTQMINQLGDIMLDGNDKSYTEVLTLFMQISSRAFPESKSSKDSAEHQGYRHCSFTVIRTLERVCAKLEDAHRLQELLPWLLELFVQRSLEIQKLCEKDKSSLKDQAGNLGVLLPVFAILLGRVETVENVNTRIQRLFRDFWQICVVMNFVTRGLGQYTEEWYEGVEAVASKTPLMSSMGADTFLEHDLQYNSALKVEGVAQEAEFRVMISETLRAPELSNVIYRMNYGQCTFFLSAYHIELMRVSQPKFTCYHLFHYLEDKGIQKDKSGIYTCFEHMCSFMFQLHLDDVAQQSRDEERQKHLENLVQFLLVKFNHCVKRIRLIADKWLSNLIDKFNHLLWSEEVLKCLAHLTQELVKAARNSSLEEGVTREVAIPYEPGTMNIPEEMHERLTMLTDFSKRFAGILRESLKFAPLEKLEVLQEFEDQLRKSIKGFEIELGELTLPADRNDELHKRDYNSSQINDNRSKYYGHIEGMKSLMHFQGAQFNFGSMILEKMEHSLKEWKNNSTGSSSVMEESINHTAAFLISEEQVNRKVLRALCWVPVTCFTSESVNIAADCWEWVVTKRPEFETLLLMENIAAWKSTVDNKVGLFSPYVPCKRPVVTDNKVQEVSSIAPHCEPHRLWIRFLTQRFEVVKYKSSQQVELFTTLFHMTLPLTSHSTSVLSNHISAIGPRFEFLNLGLRLLQNDIISNELNQSILRERLYTAILDYFCVSAQWPCYSTAECLADVEVLDKFWDTLVHDKKYLKSILVPTTISPDSIHMTNGMLGNALFAEGTNSPSVRSRSLSVERTKANSVVMKKTSKIGDYKSKYHLKKRNLILFLIHHEIERLFTWANPLAEGPPNDEKKTNFVYKNFSEKSWNEYMHLAWTCHPMIALALARRVRNSEAVNRSIRLFVKSAPANFYESVDALRYLATPQNVKLDLPQMVHLLSWAPASPLEVLSFFSKEYSENPITGMYALQSIQSYPCETLLFLVPQIVQAIRHDTHGYVRQIIFWIANLSPIVTHQVIWNIKTNMYLDEDALQMDPVIGATLEQYILEIKNTMNGAYLEFYNREFDFFNSVTEVSSIIKPYPKGPERNAECLRALSDIQVNRFGTYLPSNPDSVIIGIDYTSGKPMQSAAKAPFLATFKVKQCEVTEMQEFDLSKVDLKVGVSSKSCIFKEGDDLRQDILALQIIDFSLKAFQSVGLDVYLKPYKVVATAPGSGVIEVVPDSKTRDELGKKTDETLYNHFIKTYGDENSVGFQNARENFIKSMAGYSIVTWLLQIKDRHNGNIMIANSGHIIHIDFGFLFESSPGGNMGFEPDIKLTEEMIQIMGGSAESAPFKRFVELVVRGFLAVRPYCEAVCTLVSLMMGTNLPCFRDDALRKLRHRFQPNLSDREAANHAKKMIQNNLLNKRTVIYDKIQYYQNEIAH